MSELYASMLMMGVTLTLGSVVVAAAMGSVGQANGSVSLGSTVQLQEVGVQLALVYTAVAPSGTCPLYQGFDEGTSLTVSLFDYGTVGFAPVEFVVNSTAYPGSYPALGPGTLAEYTVTTAACVHSSGLTVAAIDGLGGGAQFAT